MTQPNRNFNSTTTQESVGSHASLNSRVGGALILGDTLMSKHPSNYVGEEKFLTIIRFKGTAREERIVTSIKMFWCQSLQDYITIPQSNN